MRGAIGVVIGLLLAVLATACSGSSARTSNSRPSIASARAVLAAEATALLHRDRAAFGAAFDRSSAASAYRAEQLRGYDNAAHVPLGSWHYVIVGAIRDRAAQRQADRRYDAPVLLLHVTVEYRLRGIDTLPDRHDQYLVFVRRGGHTLLAGDGALTGEALRSWVPPWGYGPLVAHRGAASLVLGPPSDAGLLPRLATDTDAAVAAVTRVWGTGWAQRVAVLIPSSAAEFRSLAGFPSSGRSPDASAVAVTTGIDSGTGRPYGQRLVLDPSQLARLTPVGRGIVLRHEVTHLATAAATADITPRWLIEGFAEYVANLGTGQSVRVAASELRQAVAAGHLPAGVPSDRDFAARGAALARAYEQSWLACRLIAQRIGQAGLVRFYRLIGSALEPRAQAVRDAFTTLLHESQRTFVRQWQRYLKDQLS